MGGMRARPRRAYLAALGVVTGAAAACSLAAGMMQPPAAAATTALSRSGAAPGARGAAVGAHRPAVMRPVPGVNIRHRFFSLGLHRPERVVLMRVDLAPDSGLSLDAASPGESIGARRRTVATLADRTGAVAGINADWFDLESWAAVPRGALIRDGRVLKTPQRGWAANLFVREDGTAGIGPVPFHGSVTVLDPGDRAGGRQRLGGARRERVMAVNSPSTAAHGHVVYVTHALVHLGVHRPCAVATGRTGASGQVITRVRTRVRHVRRIARGRWALMSCGHAGARWIGRALQPGTDVDVSLTFPDGRPQVAVSGGRVLIRDGLPYDDAGGQRLQGLNPETFACVNRAGRSVLLGVVDGRSGRSVGVTQPQLQHYLLARHCWSAMTFDGGGSSTIVARPPGASPQTPVEVLNDPSDGRPRPIADGLYVYAR